MFAPAERPTGQVFLGEPSAPVRAGGSGVQFDPLGRPDPVVPGLGSAASVQVGKLPPGMGRLPGDRVRGDSAFGYSDARESRRVLLQHDTGAGRQRLPRQTFRHHLLESSVLWKYTEKLGVRGYYRLEHEEIEDFHYTGLTQVIDNNIYLGAVPESYTAQSSACSSSIPTTER